MELQFGKKIVSNSYFNGEQTAQHTTYSIPVSVTDKTQALAEIIQCLEILADKQANEVVIRIKADPKTFKLKYVIKEYTVSTKK